MVSIGIQQIVKKTMSSLLKFLIIILALFIFVYAASLAMRGDLESEIIIRDYITAKSLVTTQLQLLFEKYL